MDSSAELLDLLSFPGHSPLDTAGSLVCPPQSRWELACEEELWLTAVKPYRGRVPDLRG